MLLFDGERERFRELKSLLECHGKRHSGPTVGVGWQLVQSQMAVEDAIPRRHHGLSAARSAAACGICGAQIVFTAARLWTAGMVSDAELEIYIVVVRAMQGPP